MSTFVEIDPSEYDKDAFAAFVASTSDFRIGNARALMWLSQLAYEAHREEMIREVAQKWSLTSVIPFAKRKTGLRNSYETCGIVAQREDAVMLAFAGTDPGIWQNLVTDFTPLPQAGSDVHDGFRVAAVAARGEIDRAILLAQQLQKPLFIAGHSLGAALAALASVQAATKFDEHRRLQDTDEPQFSAQLANVFQRGLGNRFSGSILSPVGPGTFGPLFRFIPPEIRGHLQDSYWKALNP